MPARIRPAVRFASTDILLLSASRLHTQTQFYVYDSVNEQKKERWPSSNLPPFGHNCANIIKSIMTIFIESQSLSAGWLAAAGIEPETPFPVVCYFFHCFRGGLFVFDTCFCFQLIFLYCSAGSVRVRIVLVRTYFCIYGIHVGASWRSRPRFPTLFICSLLFSRKAPTPQKKKEYKNVPSRNNWIIVCLYANEWAVRECERSEV